MLAASTLSAVILVLANAVTLETGESATDVCFVVLHLEYDWSGLP